jgi:hypothetical protein
MKRLDRNMASEDVPRPRASDGIVEKIAESITEIALPFHSAQNAEFVLP